MEIKLNNGLNCGINIRLPKEDKGYYEHQLKEFCKSFDSEKLISIEFGKQDIRGLESITFIDKRHCVPLQKHFNNKWELLGFVCGWNEGNKPLLSRFNEFKININKKHS